MSVDDCYTIKKVGDALKLPQGSKWYTIRDNIMKDILVAKFSQNESLLSKLHATGNWDLLEATGFEERHLNGLKITFTIELNM